MFRAPASTARSGRAPYPNGTRLCIALVLILPGWVAGQTPVDRIDDFLDSASGFSLLGTTQEGSLASGEAMRVIVTLMEGAEYMFVGYCDSDCTNLDLALIDAEENEVLTDRLPDAEPILAFTAETTGRFWLQVEATQCSSEECDVAVGILGSTSERGAVPGEDMGGRLSLMGSELEALGFSEVGNEHRGAMGTDEFFNIPISLKDGMEYRITGVCDQDCFDLDLVLFHPDGGEVSSDFLEDDIPILAYAADTTGEYTVEVIMVACGVPPCGYRIATYEKPAEVEEPALAFSGDMVFFETYRGELDSDDPILSEAYQDVYQVEAKAGERILLDLRSEVFDTFLRILDSEGTGQENDDFAMEHGHSRIEMLALTSGTYEVQVTSFTAYSTGPYTLQIAVVK